MDSLVTIGSSVPEFVATNEYVISLALEHSRRFYAGDTGHLESKLRSLLGAIGAKNRTWRAGFTKPLDHIAEAWAQCLENIGPNSCDAIGALIYCSIDKGVVEPSHASLLAQKFGLKHVRTLDISDACMGWFTATQVAHKLCERSKPLYAIISAEFPIEVPGKVYPESFKIRNDHEFLWKASALTLGECAAVTIMKVDENQRNNTCFESDHDFADLCCVPLERPDRFVDSERLLEWLEQNCFVSNIRKLTPATYRIARVALERYVSTYGIPDIILPHTVSQSGPAHVSRGLVPDTVVQNCFDIFGNISTCSIPIGYEYFNCAKNTNSHIAGWITAAGLSCSAFRIC